MKAPITLAIDELVSKQLAPFLKERGFRKKGQRFYHRIGSCIQLIELDRWKYNEGSTGKIGISVGVFFPSVWEAVNRARPAWSEERFDDEWPPIQNCLVDMSVLPPQNGQGLDNYWDIDATLPMDATAERIKRSIEVDGLAWLNANSELSQTIPRLTELSGKNVWLSSVYLLCAAVELRDKQLAEAALKAVLAPKPSRFFPQSERNAFKHLVASLGIT
ncbi:MAG: hypothetical protein CFE44_00200 [Burkholderiales bacterium PBB4]|nr:MAG: hypothetical protein CFE44_00200 [Burkholderiales bacterium PBB4]